VNKGKKKKKKKEKRKRKSKVTNHEPKKHLQVNTTFLRPRNRK
jgi:hypothetical protein